MQKTELLKTISLKRKGVYRKISWCSTLKCLKEYSDVIITKETKSYCRLGVTYSHISSVQLMNAKGELVEKNELPWGEWENDYLIQHKDKSYLRITKTLSPRHKTSVIYRKNGVAISAEEARQYTLASNWSSHNTTPVFVIPVDNILSLD